MIAPKIAAPTAIPSMRMNICEPVPMPRSCQPTLVWIATMKVVLQKPMPIPITKPAAAAQNGSVSGPSITSIAAPATSAMPPIAAVKRYEVRIISRPAAKAANIQLTDCALMTNPATAGLRPMTPCT